MLTDALREYIASGFWHAVLVLVISCVPIGIIGFLLRLINKKIATVVTETLSGGWVMIVANINGWGWRWYVLIGGVFVGLVVAVYVLRRARAAVTKETPDSNEPKTGNP
jgi:membrane associated rhomboid family serine protease